MDIYMKRSYVHTANILKHSVCELSAASHSITKRGEIRLNPVAMLQNTDYDKLMLAIAPNHDSHISPGVHFREISRETYQCSTK